MKIVAKDLDENIRRIVEGFPPRLQCVYMLRQEQNLSIKEIAEKLNVGEETVKKRKQAAKQVLKEKLGKLYVFLLPLI